jgi:DNA polymerase elongation subunit (family B)
MQTVFQQLKMLFRRLEIEVTVYEPQLVKYGVKSIKPKDLIDNPRYNLQLSLTLEDTTKFADKIGFSYCINKSGRLTIASSYFKMGERTRNQYHWVLNRTNELIKEHMPSNYKGGARKKGEHTYASLLEIARLELLNNEPAVSEYSMASVEHISYQKYEAVRHKDRKRKLSLQSKLFPKAKDYVKDIGAEHWFAYTSKRVYAVEGLAVSVPCYFQKVIDIRSYGIREVFDIEVKDSHNFLANGIVAHNCSMYPSTIIAYNIDYSTLVLDPDVPDKDCHVMDFFDHQGCEHDPKIIRNKQLSEYINKQKDEQKKLREIRDKTKDKIKRKNIIEQIDKISKELKPYQEERSNLAKSKPKVIMCEKRYYRFLKEPKGVMPTVLVNLLDARKNTRKKMKEIKELIKLKDKTHDIKDLNLLLNVLDKRQLAYKTSSNSMYGIMGVKRGLIPFMCGAMSCTYKCRENIKIAAKAIQEVFGGKLIYGD